MQEYASSTDKVPTPDTITTADGRVWVRQENPFSRGFITEYACGRYRANLMTYRHSAQVRFMSTNGKSLEMVA
ncbi:hypothetical protein [Deinococcus hopiensis]|uniref:Uncharacterized protein n=1 Tax=Deinococcus hopiensis KR-140 TaxID=695939 RepID=A0A1W1VIS0_9DEIO|nr:hypothetical protein [Deinococcus hopiensis]SMB93279.1 hypothetical protein SAMN00790413_01915 [Deinococcus hopiensis KR-140]